MLPTIPVAVVYCDVPFKVLLSLLFPEAVPMLTVKTV
jgi:hypothetical protein